MTSILRVKKRDGRLDDFKAEKITEAIWKAVQSVGGTDRGMAEKITSQVTTVLEVLFKSPDTLPTVEQIQDLVEKILIEGGHARTAKAYILYRAKRQEERWMKENLVGVGRAHETLDFDPVVLEMLNTGFLLRDQQGEVCETPMEMVRRVAHAVATPEAQFGGDVHDAEALFYEMIAKKTFVPSSVILKNAGVHGCQLADEFVVPVEDSMDGIFKALKDVAVLYKNGGTVGFSFSNLRPQTDYVAGRKGLSSGPVSFMKLFAEATAAIRKGDVNMAKNTAMLRVDHPDVMDFLDHCGDADNLGYAIGVTDQFVQALQDDAEYDLINPRTKSKIGTLRARLVFDTILNFAWKHGDMRLVFVDKLNERNYFQNCGEVAAVTPMGKLLMPYEACHSGTVNLEKFVVNRQVDWESLSKLITLGVRFLDNAIELYQSSLGDVDAMVGKTRRIYIGVIGADLVEGDVGELVQRVKEIAEKASEQLADKRGVCEGWDGSYYRRLEKKMRSYVDVGLNVEDFVSQFIGGGICVEGNYDGLGIDKVSLDADASVGDFETVILKSHKNDRCGVLVSRKRPKAVEVLVPQQTSLERVHDGISMVKEVIPPPMVEMSRIVKETLEADK